MGWHGVGGGELMPQAPARRVLSTDPTAGRPSATRSRRVLSTDPNAGLPITSGTSPPASATRGMRPPSTMAGDPSDLMTTPSPPATLGAGPNHVQDFAGEVGHALNPVEMAKGLWSMVTNLGGTTATLGAAHWRTLQEGRDALASGDYLTASRKFIHGLTPLVGPAVLEPASEAFARGEYGKGFGIMTGFGAQLAIPGTIAKVMPSRVRVIPRNPNPAMREAVEFGLREGIPVDAGTATGNPVVRGVQWGAERTGGGSVVSGRTRQAQAEGFTAVGERMATRASPSPVTAEQAGQRVREAVSQRAAGYHAEANAAYSRLRAIEAQRADRIATTGGVRGPATSPRPFTTIPLAVDITPVKTAMQPTYAALQAEHQTVPFISGSGKAKALLALTRLMDAPDMAPLSVADAALGELKSMARVNQAFARTRGQGIAAQAVTNLERSVTAAARQGGPDVFTTLTAGRAATVNKYKAIDALDQLHATEPVKVFAQLTAAKDSGLSLLRDVSRYAPQEIPTVGRAVLEGLLEKATAEGGFGRSAGLMADWQRLGQGTKHILFQNPGLVHDLDSFFLLAKRAAENPNPSGTAFQAGIGVQGALLWTNPALGVGVQLGGAGLAALLNSPRAVRLLVQGLRMPARNRVAATAVTAELAQIARESGVPLVPVMAEQEP